MDKICKKFVSKAGFSKGMLELAPKNHPHLSLNVL
ncbi:hypothetical protein cje16_00936 [Campylobacter jejuni subsp. jejuni 1997-1]|nr:hypothetical protein cje16_00936 [Campylobacter jejuni subsp. jejuni 1997-1]